MKRVIFIVLVLCANNLFSQKESYNWFFGLRQGVTFNTPNHNPDWVVSTIDGRYSCTSISDKNGNLIFYSNGSELYNSNDYKIGNIDVKSECSIIIKRPNCEIIYYLFQTYYNQLGYLTYSIIDISGNNGNGKINESGIILDSIIDVDKLTVTQHANGKDIWLATHKDYSNIYYLYLITDSDVSFHHADTVGRSLSLKNIYGIEYNNDGTMKFSPNGKKLGIICHHHGWGFALDSGWFEVMDFDNKTGKITQPVNLNIKLDSLEFSAEGYKGIEFSADSKKIYAFARQFDITIPDSITISNSAYKFITTKVIRYEAPFQKHYQLGPDGKIYFIGDKIINCISDPNESGIACNLKYNGSYYDYYSDLHYISLDVNDLPQFITNWFEFKIKAESNSEVCEGDVLELYVTDRLNARYTWTGPNGFSSTEQYPIINYAQPEMCGWYYVTAERRYDEISSDSVFVIVNTKPLFNIEPKDTVYICPLGKTNLSSNNIQNDFTYLWSTGETSSSITVDSAGKYYLTITNEYGCQSTDSVVVEYKYIRPEIEIIGNILACEGDTIVLRTKEKYDIYNWSTGDTTSEIYVTKSSKCSVSVIDSLGCTGTSEEVEVMFFPKPKVNLRGPDTVCLGSTVTYHVNKNNNVGYGWWVELGSLVPGFNSDSVKVIWLQAGKGKIVTQQTNSFGCTGIDSMHVEIIDKVKPEIIPTKPVICGDGTLTLRTSEQYDSYEWSTGETSDTIVVSSAGVYFVKVTAVGGCTGFDTVNVIKVDEPVAVIIGTTTLCKGESSVLSVVGDFSEYLWSTGETTKDIVVDQTGNYSVEITDTNGCKASASVDVKAVVITLDGLNDTDFGRISIDNKDNKNLILTNRSNESIRIEDVRLKSGSSELSITVNPQTPAVLDSGDIMVVNIGFEPDGMQEYKDSLIIEVSEPCEEYFAANVSGIGTGKMLVWLPDVTKEVGYNICIPLYAKLMNSKPITLETKFDAEIRYDVTALKPNKDFLIAGAERVINYTDIDLSIDKDTSVIAELCGTVLLARENTTPIFISDFTVSNPYCEVETMDGSLTILGCAIDISRIMLANNIEVSIYPNPTDDEIAIQIKTHLNLEGNLKIYNSYGIEVASQTQQLKSGSNLIQFNTTNLSSGIYFVKIILNGYDYIVLPVGKIQ